MSKFVSQPPSKKPDPAGAFFRGGMMPAAPRETAGLLIFDIRSLNIPAKEGREIELELREFLFKRLSKYSSLEKRSAVDLSSCVFGIAID